MAKKGKGAGARTFPKSVYVIRTADDDYLIIGDDFTRLSEIAANDGDRIAEYTLRKEATLRMNPQLEE